MVSPLNNCLSHLHIATDNVTIYFLKDIVCRRKAYLTNEEVTTIHMPHYEGLALKHVMEYISTKPRISSYLPDDVDLPKIPRQWIVNVISAVIG